ncbi:MAG: hypothetical protein ACOCY8_01565, partial [Spirochaetota bacterium]
MERPDRSFHERPRIAYEEIEIRDDVLWWVPATSLVPELREIVIMIPTTVGQDVVAQRMVATAKVNAAPLASDRETDRE